jgi:nitroimidazol reductase NimA-like FMN-containing flavoprotein (pyridoxamine 5'-phosphate oxidase superfamily)
MPTNRADLQSVAREIIDANLYMTLGTADDAGRPWVTPVYYAPVGYREFVWVSQPEAQHSRNIAVRPEISIVIYDSTVPINTGQAVYMRAVTEELQDDLLDDHVELYTNSTLARGGEPWTPIDVRPPAPHRLYRAAASRQWVLDEHDQRVPVDP